MSAAPRRVRCRCQGRKPLRCLWPGLAAFVRQEDGVISVMMLILLPAIVMIFLAGFDLTRLNTLRRDTQARADLIAFSAARHLPDRSAAEETARGLAARLPSFAPVALRPGDILTGSYSAEDGFQEAAPSETVAGAVQVILRARYQTVVLQRFLDEALFVSRRAVVLRQDMGSLTLRNALIQVNSSASPLLAALLGEQLGLNLALVSWAGLADVQLSLSDLASLISASTSASLLTFRDVLDADVSLPVLMTRLAQHGLFPVGAVGSVPAVTVRLSEILTLSPELAELSLAGTLPDIGLSVQDFLTMLAQLSGSRTHRLVSLGTALSAAPLANPALAVELVDPGMTVIGRATPAAPLTASSAQVSVTASGTLAGLLSLSVQLQGGVASASLSDLSCGAESPDDIVARLSVQTHPATLSLSVRLLEQPNGKTYQRSAPVSVSGQTHEIVLRQRDLGQRILVPNTVSLGAVSTALSSSISSLRQELSDDRGLLGILLGAVLALINSLLSSLTSLLANTALLDQAVQSLLSLLGVNVAQAEVMLNKVDCRMALVR